MNGPRRFGFLGILVTIAIVLIAGGIGYAAGLAASGAAPAYPPFGFGFGLFGFLFFLLVIWLLVSAVARPHRWGGWYGGHGHWRGYGPRGEHGPWEARDVPPFVEPMLEAWHRRAHGESPAAPEEDRGSSDSQR